MRLLILFYGLFLLFFGCRAFHSNHVNMSYVVLYSKHMISEKRSPICILSQDVKYPFSLITTFERAGDGEIFQVNKNYQCFDINVPNIDELLEYIKIDHPIVRIIDDLVVELDVNGTKLHGEQTQVQIFKADAIHQVVELDQHYYEIGDTVRVRVASLDFERKPIDNGSFNVTIYDPKKEKKMSWDNVKTTKGLVHLEFELKDPSPTGDWTVEVDNVDPQMFTVLEKHEKNMYIKVDHPHLLYYDNKALPVRVCARYLNGTFVASNTSLSAKKMFITDDGLLGYHRKPEESKELVRGCASFEISVQMMKLNKTMTDQNAFIEIEVNVFDPIAGRNIFKPSAAYMTVFPCDIVFDYEHKRLHVGLPFVGLISLKDARTKMEGKTLQICYEYQKTAQEFVGACSNVTIENEQFVHYTIPPLPMPSGGVVVIKATFLEFPDYGFTTELYPIHSRTSNGMHIEPIVHCEEKSLEFNIKYTLNKLKEAPTGIGIMVTSKFEIIKSDFIPIDKQPITFSIAAHPNVITNNSTTNLDEPFYESIYRVKLDNWKTNELLITAYYLADDEIILDSEPVSVKGCIGNHVQLSLLNFTTHPDEGCSLKIGVDTSEDSLCSIKIAEVEPYDMTNHHRQPFRPSYQCKVYPDVSSNIDQIFGTSTMLDASLLLRDSNVGFITNRALETSPCQPTETHMLKRETDVNSQEAIPEPDVPSTYFWDLMPTEENNIKFEVECPIKLTEWRVRALCSTEDYTLDEDSNVLIISMY